MQIRVVFYRRSLYLVVSLRDDEKQVTRARSKHFGILIYSNSRNEYKLKVCGMTQPTTAVPEYHIDHAPCLDATDGVRLPIPDRLLGHSNNPDHLAKQEHDALFCYKMNGMGIFRVES